MLNTLKENKFFKELLEDYTFDLEKYKDDIIEPSIALKYKNVISKKEDNKELLAGFLFPGVGVFFCALLFLPSILAPFITFIYFSCVLTFFIKSTIASKRLNKLRILAKKDVVKFVYEFLEDNKDYVKNTLKVKENHIIEKLFLYEKTHIKNRYMNLSFDLNCKPFVEMEEIFIETYSKAQTLEEKNKAILAAKKLQLTQLTPEEKKALLKQKIENDVKT